MSLGIAIAALFVPVVLVPVYLIVSELRRKGREMKKVEVGQVWAYGNKDPFTEPIRLVVADIKDGYVQYRHKGRSMLFSQDVPYFLLGGELEGMEEK